jgi:hypothetical protein
MKALSLVTMLVLAFTLASCQKDESATPPEAVTATGCKLDQPLDIQTDTLFHGAENLLVLGGLAFDQFPTGLALGALATLELHLFEQASQDSSGNNRPLGMVGYRLTDPQGPFQKGSRPVVGFIAKSAFQNRDENGVKFFKTVIGSEELPQWKMEAVMTGNRLTAIEVSYLVAQSTGVPIVETRCVKSARVLRLFQTSRL